MCVSERHRKKEIKKERVFIDFWNSLIHMKETDIVVIDIDCHSPKPIQEGTDRTPTDGDAVSSTGTTTNELAQSKCVGAVPSPDAKNEKRKTMSGKKPPKPPRPPRGLSLDAADQRLIKELSELAMIKRAARIQRIKRMKAAKESSSSSIIIAVLFTLLFCLVIIFRGCHPLGILLRNNLSAGITGSSIVMVGEESNLLRKRID